MLAWARCRLCRSCRSRSEVRKEKGREVLNAAVKEKVRERIKEKSGG